MLKLSCDNTLAFKVVTSDIDCYQQLPTHFFQAATFYCNLELIYYSQCVLKVSLFFFFYLN